MNYINEAYTNEKKEYQEVLDFFSDLYSQQQRSEEFTRTRFELWKYYSSQKGDDFYSHNLHLWRDDSKKIAGIFISEEGGNDMHVVVLPSHRSLADEILNWVFENWAAEKPDLWTQIADENSYMIELFTKRGFYKEEEDPGYGRYYDLQNRDWEVHLPEGFYIKSADEELDLPSRIELINNAFEQDKFNQEIYRAMEQTHSYSAHLNLSVFNSKGEHVSTCMGWVDERNQTAEIETVATHCEYRQRGLARAVITECLSRLKKMGYATASIGSGEELTHKFYDSFGYIRRDRGYGYSWDRK